MELSDNNVDVEPITAGVSDGDGDDDDGISFLKSRRNTKNFTYAHHNNWEACLQGVVVSWSGFFVDCD